MEKTTERENGKIVEIVKALVLSVIITLVLILVAAFAIKIFNVPSDYIPIVNQIIKSVAILVGALVFLRQKGGGFIRGIILGVAYTIATYLIFSAMNGSFAFSLSLLNDLALGAVSGFISGIIAVNIRK